MRGAFRLLLALALVGVGALGAGCATLADLFRDQVEDPQVTVLGFDVRHMGLDVISTTFHVRLDNPNAFGLILAGIEYQLHVEGERFAEGRSQREVALAPLGATWADLDVDFPLATAGRPLLEILAKEQLAYTLDAAFLVGTESVHLAIPATFEGTVDVPKAPTVSVRAVEFPQVSLAGISVRVTVTVGNENRFDIPLDELRATFALGGRTILENRALPGVLLQAGQSTDVPVDLLVELSELGLSLEEIADKKELAWRLELRLQSGTTVLPFLREGRRALMPAADGRGSPGASWPSRPATDAVAGCGRTREPAACVLLGRGRVVGGGPDAHELDAEGRVALQPAERDVPAQGHADKQAEGPHEAAGAPAPAHGDGVGDQAQHPDHGRRHQRGLVERDDVGDEPVGTEHGGNLTHRRLRGPAGASVWQV